MFKDKLFSNVKAHARRRDFQVNGGDTIEVGVPILDGLERTLATVRRADLTFIRGAKREPLDKDSFGKCSSLPRARQEL